MYCSECGSELVENSKFCMKCGTAVEENTAPPVIVSKDSANPPTPAVIQAEGSVDRGTEAGPMAQAKKEAPPVSNDPPGKDAGDGALAPEAAEIARDAGEKLEATPVANVSQVAWPQTVSQPERQTAQDAWPGKKPAPVKSAYEEARLRDKKKMIAILTGIAAVGVVVALVVINYGADSSTGYVSASEEDVSAQVDANAYEDIVPSASLEDFGTVEGQTASAAEELKYLTGVGDADFTPLAAMMTDVFESETEGAAGGYYFAGTDVIDVIETVLSKNKIADYFIVNEAGEDPVNQYQTFYDCILETGDGTKHIYVVVYAEDLSVDSYGTMYYKGDIVIESSDNWNSLLDKFVVSRQGTFAITEMPADGVAAPLEAISQKGENDVFDQNGIVIADSNARYVSEGELRALTHNDEYPLYVVLGFARNEIFARHGDKFTSPHYLNHYSQYDWYNGMQHHAVSENELNAYEKANIDTILAVEHSMEVHTQWTNVSASSYYSSPTAAYPARLAVDGQKSTAWAEGDPGSGVEEWIMVSSGSQKALRGITLVNGYAASQEAYTVNNRPKKVRVTFSDGTSQDFDIADTMEEQTLLFAPYKETSSVKIEILEVYVGTAPAVMFISEIGVIEVQI